MIIGMDLVQIPGINVDCGTKAVTWPDSQMLFQPQDHFSNPPLFGSLAATCEFDKQINAHSAHQTVHQFDEKDIIQKPLQNQNMKQWTLAKLLNNKNISCQNNKKT